MAKIENEKRVVETMIRLYCRRRMKQNNPPDEYMQLIESAHKRLSHCRFGEKKTSCKRCPIHCYAPEKREMMRQVMRWCGPRMIFFHPIITIRHFI